MRKIETKEVIYLIYEPEENPIGLVNIEIFCQVSGGDANRRRRIIALPESMVKLVKQKGEKY